MVVSSAILGWGPQSEGAPLGLQHANVCDDDTERGLCAGAFLEVHVCLFE